MTTEQTFTVDLTQAAAILDELVARAEMGESIILAEHGRPVVRLVPAERARTDLRLPT